MDVGTCIIFITYISLEILHASMHTVLTENHFKAAVVRRGKGKLT